MKDPETYLHGEIEALESERDALLENNAKAIVLIDSVKVDVAKLTAERDALKAEVERLKAIFVSQEGMYRELIATREDLHHEMNGTKILTTDRDRWRTLAEELAEALKETRDAAAYLMRFIFQHGNVIPVEKLDHKYDGFGKRAEEALAAYDAIAQKEPK